MEETDAARGKFWENERALAALGIGTILALWWLATDVLHLANPKFLASPVDIVREFGNLWQNGYANVPLGLHFAASLQRTLLGYALGACLAIPVGLIMGLNVTVRGLLNPVFNLLRPIPVIALIPLMVLWFGIGETSKIFVIFLASFLYIVLNTMDGVATIPEGWLRAAVNLGASPFSLFWRVILPASLPSIITGLKMGLAVSWAVVVAAELIAAQRGLGYMIQDAATFYRITDVYIGIFLIGIIGLAMTSLLGLLEKRMLHWAGKS